MFDSSSRVGNELLSAFGRNTAVTVRHNYGTDTLEVVSARTNLIISEVLLAKEGYVVDRLFVAPTLAAAAMVIMGNKKFPKNRKMNKSWSPIRFSAASKAMMEADSGISFS
jgi:hypothetical protein